MAAEAPLGWRWGGRRGRPAVCELGTRARPLTVAAKLRPGQKAVKVLPPHTLALPGGAGGGGGAPAAAELPRPPRRHRRREHPRPAAVRCQADGLLVEVAGGRVVGTAWVCSSR